MSFKKILFLAAVLFCLRSSAAGPGQTPQFFFDFESGGRLVYSFLASAPAVVEFQPETSDEGYAPKAIELMSGNINALTINDYSDQIPKGLFSAEINKRQVVFNNSKIESQLVAVVMNGALSLINDRGIIFPLPQNEFPWKLDLHWQLKNFVIDDDVYAAVAGEADGLVHLVFMDLTKHTYQGFSFTQETSKKFDLKNLKAVLDRGTGLIKLTTRQNLPLRDVFGDELPPLKILQFQKFSRENLDVSGLGFVGQQLPQVAYEVLDPKYERPSEPLSSEMPLREKVARQKKSKSKANNVIKESQSIASLDLSVPGETALYAPGGKYKLVISAKEGVVIQYAHSGEVVKRINMIPDEKPRVYFVNASLVVEYEKSKKRFIYGARTFDFLFSSDITRFSNICGDLLSGE